MINIEAKTKPDGIGIYVLVSDTEKDKEAMFFLPPNPRIDDMLNLVKKVANAVKEIYDKA